MDETRTYGLPGEYAESREISTTQLLGQVMFLVAIGIGFLAAGAYVGRNLEWKTAQYISFAGFGMLILGSFVKGLRMGPMAMGYFFLTALVIGLGLGPVLNYYADTQPSALYEAIGVTALIVAGTGAGGFALSKDLKAWMRPLSFVVLGLVLVSLVMVFAGSGGSPLISAAIGAVSAVLIVVDFNYLRKHGTEQDAVWLATGIFVSIVNIFLSLLNIFSR